MTINEERVGQIEFSDPYFIAKGRILVQRTTPRSPASTTLAGKNVCTALGSTYEATLKEQAPEAKLKLVDSYSECLELLQNGARRRDLHRRRDPHRHDHPGRHAQARRRRAHAGALRRRHQEGRHGAAATSSTTCFEEYKSDGRWQRPTTSGSASTPDEQAEPPTMTRRRGGRAGQAERRLASCPPAALRLRRHADGELRRVRSRASGSTVRLVVVSFVIAMVVGTLVAALRVAPNAWLQRIGGGVRRDLPQHPAARAAVHLLSPACGGPGWTSAPWVGRRRLARPLHGGLRRRGAALRRVLGRARARSRRRCRSASAIRRRCGGSCCRRRSGP